MPGAGLQRSIALLADRIASLPRRFGISQGVSTIYAPHFLEGLSAAGREAAYDYRLLASNVCKASEARVEEARVWAQQLEAYALLLNREAEDGEEWSLAATVARALLSFPPFKLTAPTTSATSIAVTFWDSASLSRVVEEAVHVRCGTSPPRCTVTGEGIDFCQASPCCKSISVAAVDLRGDVVESIEAEDICVSVDGGSVVSVAVKVAGVVQAVYQAPAVGAVKVRVSVCGH